MLKSILCLELLIALVYAIVSRGNGSWRGQGNKKVQSMVTNLSGASRGTQ